MKRVWNWTFGGWVILIVLISALALVAIAQLKASGECRERGGLPVRGQWSSIECAQKAGGRNE